jgi:polyhydroxybutyrate depolymerase
MIKAIPRGWRPLATMTALVVAVVLAGCSSSGSASPSPSTGPAATASDLVADGAPVPSSGCARPSAPSVTSQRQNLTVDGSARWYLLDTPAPSTPSPTRVRPSTPSTTNAATVSARPLVLDFHGLAEGAVIHSDTTQFGVLGQQDGFVVAFPQGTGTPVQWDTTSQKPTNPDLRYVTAMLDRIESTQCIDTSRVYASGFSDGSFMVSLLACTMSNRFAAIAAVSGLQLPKPCPTTRRVPILAFHGTADPILFFNGGVGTATLNKVLGKAPPASASTTTTTTRPAHLHGPGYPATVQAWAVKDGCDPRSSDTKRSSQVILRTYRCPPGTDVEFYIILGGGHAWPGSKISQELSSVTGFTTFQINATDVIWSFFRRFQR